MWSVLYLFLGFSSVGQVNSLSQFELSVRLVDTSNPIFGDWDETVDSWSDEYPFCIQFNGTNNATSWYPIYLNNKFILNYTFEFNDTDIGSLIKVFIATRSTDYANIWYYGATVKNDQGGIDTLSLNFLDFDFEDPLGADNNTECASISFSSNIIAFLYLFFMISCKPFIAVSA